jgi:hypothetical protein
VPVGATEAHAVEKQAESVCLRALDEDLLNLLHLAEKLLDLGLVKLELQR